MFHHAHLGGFVGRVSRPKLTGLGTHAGVLLPSGKVAHLTTAGESIVSFAEFAQGKTVRAEQGADPSTMHQIESRAQYTLGRTLPYDAINRNCEHYASYVMGKKPESPQVVVGALLLGVLGAVFLAAQ